jgi:hypothetical protein
MVIHNSSNKFEVVEGEKNEYYGDGQTRTVEGDR